MNNSKIIIGASLAILVAVYAFSTLNTDEKPTAEAKPNVTKTSQPASKSVPPTASNNAQPVLLAPPSRDKPSDEVLAARIPQNEAPRIAPPPPIASGNKRNAHDHQEIAHGHHTDHSEDDENRPAPPTGANQ